MAGTVKTKTKFYGSNVGGGLINKYKYTDVPNKLLFWDIFYVFYYARSLPLIIRPLWPKGPSEREFDELAWGGWNAYCIAVHTILIVMQLGFLMSIPVAFFVPPWVTAVFVAAFWAVNSLLCWTLNGKVTTHWSNDEYTKGKEVHKNEQWLYINGIATGKHWLQSNLDRLALTFGRPVKGIHNSTSGIIFDLLECIVQRTFGYATRDIRYGYAVVKKALSKEENTKVVLILHSQGGIEGGIIVDWLLQSLPQEQLHKLEVYTFGNAANHFNNPFRTANAKVKAEQKPLAAAVDAALLDPTATKPAEGGKPKETGNHGLPPTPPTPRSPSTPTMLSSPPPSPGKLVGCETDSSNPVSLSGSAIGHIEHYCHSTDFVAQWGALHFKGGGTPKPNAPVFLGRAFRRTAKGNEGHLLCQHYLNAMFPLQRDGGTGKLVGCAETNQFMDSEVTGDVMGDGGDEGQQQPESPRFDMMGREGTDKTTRKIMVKHLSRLWQYRNGRSPGVKA